MLWLQVSQGNVENTESKSQTCVYIPSCMRCIAFHYAIEKKFNWIEISALKSDDVPKERRQSLRLKFQSINLHGDSILIFQRNLTVSSFCLMESAEIFRTKRQIMVHVVVILCSSLSSNNAMSE